MLRGFLHAGRPVLQITDAHTESASGIDAADVAELCGDTADGERYQLVSIAAALAPDGCTGGGWFVYRIVQGKNGITGYRRGTLEGVSADVQSIVTSLNGHRDWTKPAKRKRREAAAARTRAAK